MLTAADFSFQTPQCRVRPVCVADAPVLAAIYSDARTQQFVGQLLPQATAVARIEVCARVSQRAELQKFYLALENSQQQLAGMLAVFDIQADASSVELGIMLLPGRQQAGLAKVAYAGLIQRAFTLGFAGVQAGIAPQNLAALRLVRLCGMQLLSVSPAEVRYCISR